MEKLDVGSVIRNKETNQWFMVIDIDERKRLTVATLIYKSHHKKYENVMLRGENMFEKYISMCRRLM